jgi:hypothetical protein
VKAKTIMIAAEAKMTTEIVRKAEKAKGHEARRIAAEAKMKAEKAKGHEARRIAAEAKMKAEIVRKAEKAKGHEARRIASEAKMKTSKPTKAPSTQFLKIVDPIKTSRCFFLLFFFLFCLCVLYV